MTSMRRALMVCVLGWMVGCGDTPAPAAMTDAGPQDMRAPDAGRTRIVEHPAP